jgi:hypothetical protein
VKKYNGVTVLIADGEPDAQGDRFKIEDVALPEGGLVFIRRDFDIRQPLGRARLRREGNRILADIEILTDADVAGTYPGVGGIYVGEDRHGMEVHMLSLSGSANPDKRIEPLTETNT